MPINPKRFTLQFGAGKLGPLPFAGFEAGVSLRDVAREGQNHGHGMFGGGNGISTGNVHDDHALTAGRRHIDIVDAHAGAPDDLYFLARGENLGGDFWFRSGR